jgi:hypothetical protein
MLDFITGATGNVSRVIVLSAGCLGTPGRASAGDFAAGATGAGSDGAAGVDSLTA